MSLCVFVVLFETGTVLLKLYEVLTFLDEGIVLIEQPNNLCLRGTRKLSGRAA